MQYAMQHLQFLSCEKVAWKSCSTKLQVWHISLTLMSACPSSRRSATHYIHDASLLLMLLSWMTPDASVNYSTNCSGTVKSSTLPSANTTKAWSKTCRDDDGTVTTLYYVRPSSSDELPQSKPGQRCRVIEAGTTDSHLSSTTCFLGLTC